MTQFDLFGNEIPPDPTIFARTAKRSWEDRFQRWSDKKANDKAYQSEPYGKCGYGTICDYCEDNSYGRPCVRALNALLREEGKTIDYQKTTFEEAWDI